VRVVLIENLWVGVDTARLQQKSNERKRRPKERTRKERERGENMGQRKIAHNVFLFLTDEKKKKKKTKKKVRKSSNRRRQEREEQEANRSSMETIPQW